MSSILTWSRNIFLSFLVFEFSFFFNINIVLGLYAGGRPNFEQVPAAMLAIRVPVAQWLERPN